MRVHSYAIAAACAAIVLSACKSAADADAPIPGQPDAADAPASQAAAGVAGTSIDVAGAWVRATLPGSTASAAYFTITNHGRAPDVLRSVSSPVSARVELHRTAMVDGVARMRPAGDIEVRAGASLSAEPGALHVMLLELARPLQPGEQVPIRLHFAEAGEISVQAEVLATVATANHGHVAR